MTSKTENVKLGVCSVIFDGVDLGYTKGGVEVTVDTTTKKVQVDQFGESEINEYITGRTVKAKVPLAETTLENLVRIMPGATLHSSGGAKASGTVTFSTDGPDEGDKVTVNGVDFTFTADPVDGNDIDLADAVTINAAATALAAAVNASIDPRVVAVSASANAGVVTFTADDEGVAGNAITLAADFATAANAVVVAMSGGIDATKKVVVVQSGVGTSLLSLAKKLVMHPIALPAEDRSEDVTFPKAMTPGQMTWSFKLDEERLYSVEFTAYPDAATKTQYYVGDESAIPA